MANPCISTATTLLAGVSLIACDLQPPPTDAADPPIADAALRVDCDIPDRAILADLAEIADLAEPPIPDLAEPPISDLSVPPIPDLALPPIPDLALPPNPDLANPACHNLVQDGRETDIDCGGPDCGKCLSLHYCNGPGDCQSDLCIKGLCSSCFDGIADGNETDADCGGSDCGPCADRMLCQVDGDCESGHCLPGLMICDPRPFCRNGVQDMGEIDVDCGGPCPVCPSGRHCKVGSDCSSGECLNGTCTATTCPPGTRVESSMFGSRCVCDARTCEGCCDAVAGCMTGNGPLCGRDGVICSDVRTCTYCYCRGGVYAHWGACAPDGCSDHRRQCISRPIAGGNATCPQGPVVPVMCVDCPKGKNCDQSGHFLGCR